MRYLLITLLLFSFAYGEEYQIQLKEPYFSNGVLKTQKGGVIQGSSLRVQARHIEYGHQNEESVKYIFAEKDLLVEYQGRIFVGETLSYDLTHHRGLLKQGRALLDHWFVGSQDIYFLPDGTFQMTQAYVTTEAKLNPWWQVESSHLQVSKDQRLTAYDIKPYFLDKPLFWIPLIRWDLKSKGPHFQYKILWNELFKQKFVVRYKFYHSDIFDLYGRLDYPLKEKARVIGEASYLSTDQKICFETQNYISLGNQAKPFRFQGLLRSSSEDERTQLHLSYDKISNLQMIQDFKNEDFEKNRQCRSILWMSHYGNTFFIHSIFQPCLNSFQSINQHLPQIILGIRPYPIGSSKWLLHHQLSIGYFCYHFSDFIDKPSYASGRIEHDHSLYRHFSLGPFSLIPSFGIKGIFYSQTPQNNNHQGFVKDYRLKLHTIFYRDFEKFRHYVKPYLEYIKIDVPDRLLKNHYIFSLKDGLSSQSVLKLGIYEFFYRTHSPSLPIFSINFFYPFLFKDHYLFQHSIKCHLSTETCRPSWNLTTEWVYNFSTQMWDRLNFYFEKTVSENLAYAFELRKRSSYDWRKVDYENYQIDTYRSIPTLLQSPLSDSRTTLLTRFCFRITPLWILQATSHHGWGRSDEPYYNAYEIKISTYLTGKWLFEIGLQYSPGLKEWTFPSVKLLNAHF